MSVICPAVARWVSRAYFRQAPAARIASFRSLSPYPVSSLTPNCSFSSLSHSDRSKSRSSTGVRANCEPPAGLDRSSENRELSDSAPSDAETSVAIAVGKMISRGANDATSSQIFCQASDDTDCVTENCPADSSRNAAAYVSPRPQTAAR